MTSALPDLAFDGGLVLAYRHAFARKHVPGFCDLWVQDAAGTTHHLRFRELRGLSDTGLCGRLLLKFEEQQSSRFVQSLPITPIFAQSRPGRIFRFFSARESGRSHQLAEIVAAEVAPVQQPEPVPEAEEIAAPIAWADAPGLLQNIRPLGLSGFVSDDGPAGQLRLGSPRGEYVVRAVPLSRMEDRGYPGDKGLGSFTHDAEGFEHEFGCGPGGHSGSEWPVDLRGAKLSVHKVVKAVTMQP